MVRRAGRLLWIAWTDKPTAVTVPLVMIPIGVAALILGENVSKAFTNLGGGAAIRIVGAAMLLGGSLVAVGIVRNDAFTEAIGLALATFGAGWYGIGVILGLGVQGIVAGFGYLGIAVAFIGRILLLLRKSHITTERAQ